MNKLLSVVLLVFLGSGAMATEKHFKRLDRSFKKSPSKGFEKAYKWSKKFPKEPDAHFFLTTYYLDKAEEYTQEQKRFRYINRAASSAYKFKKYRGSADYFPSKADSLLKHVCRALEPFWDSAVARKDEDFADRVKFKYDRIADMKLPKKEERDELAKQEEERIAEQSRTPMKVADRYRGLPTGGENIPGSDDSKERQMLTLINAERKRKGMRELIWEPNLIRAARYHAYDMAKDKYFSHSTHDRIDGELIQIGGAFTRMRKFNCPYFENSENIAAGNSTATATYRQWYNSKGHHDNMFNKNSKYVGIGMVHDPNSPYGYYWVFCTAK